MTHTPVIAIIGGGLSGAAVAYHLAETLRPGEADVVVVEPKAELGRGLAYSTTDPVHRLNVPAHKMSLRSDAPEHFKAWLAGPAAPALTPDATAASGDVFAPRAVFGRYVADMLAPLLATGRVRHVQASVAAANGAEGHRLLLSDGSQLYVDLLVLAASHPKPGLPRQLIAIAGHPALITDPFDPMAFENIPADARLLIVGNGLTSADILATLHRRGHVGPITTLSRHGWRSQPHGTAQGETKADFAEAPARRALELLGRVRKAVARDQAAGLTWHAAFDKLRAQGPAIWAALPMTERARFLRHLRALWDVHRFRIAPQTLDTNHKMHQSGQLSYLTGRITRVSLGDPLDLRVTLRTSRETVSVLADRVILATGPAHGSVVETQPALSDLAFLGLVQADPLRLGIHTAADGHAIPVAGSAADGFVLVAGPLARGTVGELMGVPEVITWAEHVARTAVAQLRQRRASVAAG